MKRKITIEFEVTTNDDFNNARLQKRLERCILLGSAPEASQLEGEIEEQMLSVLTDMEGGTTDYGASDYKKANDMRFKVTRPVVTVKAVK